MAEVTIEQLGRRGDGIAPGPVYVPRTLPGERVVGEIRDGQIVSPTILAPSPERVAAPCPHYTGCGGCDLQHATAAFVAGWKAERVKKALAKHGLAAPIRHIATSPPESRRRATFAARRTKTGVIAGFHGRRSETLVAVDQCRVLTPGLRRALPIVAALAAAGASRKGTLAVTATETESGLDMAVRGGKPADHDLAARLVAVASGYDLARLSWEDEILMQAAQPVVSLGGARVALPPGAFLQATAAGEAALQASVAEAVAPADRVADLFAGCGTFALPLAAAAEVHAVEMNAAMLAALSHAARTMLGLRPLSTARQDLFRTPVSDRELDRFDAVVIDPPRAGAAAQCSALAAASVGRVAMVSCDPESFARDVATLVAGGFGLSWIDIVDQFRWSPHVELAAALVRD